jgi:dipicolinate synthase subunit B
MQLEGLKIGFALTGSFCTLERIMKEVEAVVKEGAIVYPIISCSVDEFDTRFGTAQSFKDQLVKITGHNIIRTIIEAEPIGPKNLLDVLVIAPCTGNTLGKISNAITDTPVTMAFKAHMRNNKPAIIAISTNDALGVNAKNIGALLNMKNVFLVPFGQDDPVKKCNSIIAKYDLIIPTIIEAMKGNQIQPILVKK